MQRPLTLFDFVPLPHEDAEGNEVPHAQAGAVEKRRGEDDPILLGSPETYGFRHLPLARAEPPGENQGGHPVARVAWLEDPRSADLAADTARWQLVLAAAFLRDGERTDGVFGVLHGVRCCGARLEIRREGRLHLVAGPDYLGDFAADRARWLVPHRDGIMALLAACALPASPPTDGVPDADDAAGNTAFLRGLKTPPPSPEDPPQPPAPLWPGA